MRKQRSENPSPFWIPLLEPLLVVLSGPSGVGKDVLINELRKSLPSLCFVTTVTTRAQRSNEKDMVHYNFVTQGKFQDMRRKGELLEYANVYGNWYGVPALPVKRALESGQDTIVKVDVQGATTIKANIPGAILIMLAPSSIDDLMRRLNQRRTETPFDLELRVRTAKAELEKVKLFDYVVINRENGLDQAASEINAIIIAEKHRVISRKINL